MGSIGIVRRIDKLGRITLAKEDRTVLGINEQDPVLMVREGNEYFESYVPFFVYDNIVYVLFPTAATKEQIITTLESLV